MPFTEYTTEVIVGIVASIGGVILVLNRFGLIKPGRKKEIREVKSCPMHEGLQKQIVEVHDNQIKNIQLHEQHTKDLEAGWKEFKSVKKELTNLSVGIAVLLDRSGGRPKRWKEDGE